MTLFGFGKKKEKEINAPVCTCNRKNNFLKLVFRHKKSSLDSMNNIN